MGREGGFLFLHTDDLVLKTRSNGRAAQVRPVVILTQNSLHPVTQPRGPSTHPRVWKDGEVCLHNIPLFGCNYPTPPSPVEGGG